MLKRIVTFLSPPLFEDDEQTRVARLLNTISLAILALFVVVGAMALVTIAAPLLPLQSALLGALIRVGVLFLMQRRRLRLASVLLCAVLWVIVTIVSALFGGIGSPVVAGYGIVILIAGLLLEMRAGVLFAALSALGAVGIFYNEQYQALRLPTTAVTPALAWVIQTVILSAIAFLLYLMTRDLRNTLARVRRNERAQLEANRELIALRTTLDRRAAELERAQQRLFDSEKVYETLVENLPMSIFRKDLEGRFTFANRRFCEEMGKARAEILGKTDFDLYPPARAEQYRAQDQQMCARGEVFETVEEQQVPGGEPTFVQVVKTLTHDVEGRLTGIQGVFWDITEQKRAELVLRQSRDELEKQVQARTAQLAQERNLLRTLIDNLPDAIYIKDSASRYLVSNPAHAKFLGLDTPDQVVGRTVFDFFPPEFAAQARADDLQVMQSGAPLINREEQAIVAGAGKTLWNLTTKVPLHNSAGEVIGLLGIARDITERKRAEEELRRRADEFAALYETTRDLATPQDLPSLLRAIVERAAALLAAPGGTIYLYDAARGDLEVTLATDPLIPLGTRINLGEGMAGRVAQTRQPLIVNDYSTWPQRSPKYEGVPVGAVVEAPMLYGGELIGVLAVQETGGKAREFTDADARLLTLFAGQAAGAVHTARLFAAVQQELAERKRAEQEIRQRNQELAALNQIGQALSKLAPPAEILELIFTLIGQVLDNRNFYIALYDETNQQIAFPIYTIDGVRRNVASRSFSDGLTEYVITTKAPLLLPRDVGEQGARLGFVAKGRPARCLLAVPMLAGKKVIGVMTVQDYEKEEVYNQRHLELLSTFAAQAAIALENAQLYQETRQRAREFAALYETARDLAMQQDLPTVLQTIVERARALLATSHGIIFLFDPTRRDLEVAVATDPATPPGTRLQLGEGLAGRVAQTREPMIVNDYSAWQHRSSKFDGLSVSALAEVPMLYGGELIGVLGVNEMGETTRQFTDADVRLLSLFAGQAASAVHDARLHAAEKQHAQELEQAYRSLQQNQAQLLLSEKMASLGRLTAGIAHEMNTPLAAVRAALVEAERLVNEYQTSIGDADVTPEDHRGIAEEMRQSLQLAVGAAERAATFVRGIKTQTRDLIARESQRFNAVPVIRETLLLLGHTLRAGNCKADFEPAVEKVELAGSPSRLAQVVTNLVTNAVDACAAKGGGAIRLRLTARANEVELQVSDTGAGIPPEILPKIFDPLFTTKPFGQGTGLGLAIVHDIVAGEFGGTIEVASQVDQGATFTLHFPKSKEDQHAA